MKQFPPVNERILSENAINYLNERGISKETAEKCGVFSINESICDNSTHTWYNGVDFIVFPNSSHAWNSRATVNDEKKLPKSLWKRKGSEYIDGVKGEKYPQTPFGFIHSYYTKRGGVYVPDMPDWVFLCEGEFDALTLMEHNLPSVSTGGAGIIRKFFELVKEKEFKLPYIIVSSFDNDNDGKKAYNAVNEYLIANNFRGVYINFWDKVPANHTRETRETNPLWVKDINEYWVKYPEQFNATIYEIRKIWETDGEGNMGNYIHLKGVEQTPVTVVNLNTRNDEQTETVQPSPLIRLLNGGAKDENAITETEKRVAEFNQKYSGVSQLALFHNRQNNPPPVLETPYSALNETLMGGYRSGLHFFSGETGLGKTAFMLQMGRFYASKGQKVYYYTYEISFYEIIGRILSSLTYEINKDINTALSYYETQERKRFHGGKYYELSTSEQQCLSGAENIYKQIAPNFFIIDGCCSTEIIDVNVIGEQVADITAVTQKPPVVFIDYLQLIPPADPRMNDKQITDYNVRTLKDISTKTGAYIFAVTSMNRTAYGKAPTEKSGKESGLIEYMADSYNSLSFTPNRDLTADEIREYKGQTEREIYLHLIKSRNTLGGQVITFNNIPKCGVFTDKGIYTPPPVTFQNTTTANNGYKGGKGNKKETHAQKMANLINGISGGDENLPF